MYRDGICMVTDRYFSKTIRFQDINYRLAAREEKDAILNQWCGLLNYFPPSVTCQLSFLSMMGNREVLEKTMVIHPQEEDHREICEELTHVLQDQMEKGNNGYVKSKFLTFGLEAHDYRAAKSRLNQIESDLLVHFKQMGVSAHPLDGKERLELLHGVFHMDEPERQFQFEWDWLPASGLSTKDFIAPSSFSFQESSRFTMGSKLATVNWLYVSGSQLFDDFLAKLLSLDACSIVTFHLKPVDQTEALKMVRKLITTVDQAKIDEQKKAIRSGYDMDILPKTLTSNVEGLEKWLNSLQKQNERMYLVTALVMYAADSKRQLANIHSQLKGITQERHSQLIRLDFQQEDALVSSLPLGLNRMPVQQSMTTECVAGFVPFVVQELFQTGGRAIYYGVNTLSNNLVIGDRTSTNNPNGVIFGKPGSGKSFASKREMIIVFLLTKDGIVICDPEGEYRALVERLKGQVIRLSPTSPDHINPMDIPLDYDAEENVIAVKADFILSLCELLLESKDGLQPIEKSIIGKSVQNIYERFFRDPRPENMPILSDLHAEILKNPAPEAQRIAAALDLYVSGVLNCFNHRTNVNLNNRLICYDTKELGRQLKKVSMLIVQDQVWSRLSANRNTGRSTWYYIDEMHLLLKEPQTASYMVENWKRFRKWGGIPTGMTQNAKDLLASREIENILENSDFVYMLSQSDGDRAILAQKLGLSDSQLEYVKNVPPGEGIMFFGDKVIPFRDRYPKDTMLYRLMTTKPGETQVKEGDDG